MTPTIGLLGDVMLGRGVASRLAEVDPEDVWAPEVREVCGACDLVVCNLECCISGRGSRTERVRGKPYFFRGPPDAVRSLEAIQAGMVGLANNHALDYETDALIDTVELVSGAGIAVAGAGPNFEEARRAAIVDAGGARVGLVSVADHPGEFSATEDEPGIAFADLHRAIPEWLEVELARAREKCDWLIAFPHWGPNLTTEPAPWQLRAAEALQRAGADLVAGHSSHVFHGVGWGRGHPVLFDLGDALDDYAVDRRLRNDLGLMAIWRPGDTDCQLELVGLALDFCHTRLADGQDAEWIARRLGRASRALGTRVERTSENRFRVYESGRHD